MYVKKMSEKRKMKYEGLFRACEDLAPGKGQAFIYDTKAEAQSAKAALYNYLKIRGLIVQRRIQKIGNDSTKFYLENTCKLAEIVEIVSDMGILKDTLYPYSEKSQTIIIDFLRDSRLLSIDQAVKLNTFCQKIESGSNANTGRNFEEVQKMANKTYVRKSNISEAIQKASEKFPTPELPKENPIQNPFEEV